MYNDTMQTAYVGSLVTILILHAPLMAKFPDIFLPHFFSFAIESYIYETDFTLQKYHF